MRLDWLADEDTGALSFQSWTDRTTSRQISYKTLKTGGGVGVGRIRRGSHGRHRPGVKEERVTREDSVRGSAPRKKEKR
jgi:hypothetical protein